MTKRFSAHQFSSKLDLGFDPIEYSKFKFGCKDVSRKFGTELATKFIASEQFNEIVKLSKTKKIIVLSSPYNFIPTATFAMKDYFVREMNAALVERNCNPIIEAKIFRNTSYKEDYGEMSSEERFNLISQDKFYVDANFLENNICIFLDDVIITGGHERVINKMLDDHKLTNSIDAYFLYYGELTNIHEDPKIENYLNYAYVKSLVDLDKVIKNNNFLLNTRTVKYILNSPHHDCITFLQYQPEVFLNTLYHQAIGNGYHKEPDYQLNFMYLKHLITKTK